MNTAHLAYPAIGYIYIYIICIYPLENPLQKLNEENRNMAKTSVL